MRPNCTSINQYLPNDKKVYKPDVQLICKRLNVFDRNLDRDKDSKLLADTWLLILEEQLLAHKVQMSTEKRLSILFRY